MIEGWDGRNFVMFFFLNLYIMMKSIPQPLFA